METETRTDVTPDGFGGFTIDTPRQVIRLTETELHSIVQAAYDQHGLLAEPSLEVERVQYEARLAEAEDADLRTFADAWGDSMRAKA